MHHNPISTYKAIKQANTVFLTKPITMKTVTLWSRIVDWLLSSAW